MSQPFTTTGATPPPQPPVFQQPYGNNLGAPPPPYFPPGQGPQYQAFTTSPQTISNVHLPGPDLDALRALDHVFIKQENTDVFFNSNNYFKVLTPNGQQIFAIVEKTGALMRLFGGGNQSFKLFMKDMRGQDVLYIEGSPGFWGRAGVNVSYQNTFIGGVRQTGDFCNSQYDIVDSGGNLVLIVKSQDNMCCVGFGGVAEFPILTPDGAQIGRIGKEWGGLGREMFTTADKFGINFPTDLHVAVKAVLLAATIMIDFQFFERR